MTDEIASALEHGFSRVNFEKFTEEIKNKNFKIKSPMKLTVQKEAPDVFNVFHKDERVARLAGPCMMYLDAGETGEFAVEFSNRKNLLSEDAPFSPTPELNLFLNFFLTEFLPARQTRKKEMTREALARFEYSGRLKILIEVIEEDGFVPTKGAAAQYHVVQQDEDRFFIFKGDKNHIATFEYERADYDPRAYMGSSLQLAGQFRYPLRDPILAEKKPPILLPEAVELLEYHEQVFLPSYQKKNKKRS